MAKENVVLAIDGDRGGEMLFRQLNETLKIDFVAQAPVGQEGGVTPIKDRYKVLGSEDGSIKIGNVKLLRRRTSRRRRCMVRRN